VTTRIYASKTSVTSQLAEIRKKHTYSTSVKFRKKAGRKEGEKFD
jgi:hypothetical protein